MSGTIGAVGAASSSSQASAISQAGTTALGSLTDNFSNFLSMLMTQLQNQDPSSPMDSSSFTTELVQFSSVEQQISTNTNLTQLIQLTQATQVEQSASLVGKPVTVNSTQLVLQNSSGTINFNTPNPEPVAISVVNASGVQVGGGTIPATQAGANSWTWDGTDGAGNTLPDGVYTTTISALGANGAKTTQVPFTVTGTATSVQNNAGVVQLQMGGLTVPFSAVQSVGQ